MRILIDCTWYICWKTQLCETLKNTCPFWDNGMPITKGKGGIESVAGHLPSPLRADIWLQTFNPAGKCHATEFSPQDNDPSTPEAEWHPQHNVIH